MKKVRNRIWELPRKGRPSPPAVSCRTWHGTDAHHTKGGGGPSDIARYHVAERGYRTIGYPFVWDAGEMSQCLTLEEIGAHAARYHNRHRIGIAMVGDFDRYFPSEEAYVDVAELHALLAIWLGWPGPHELVGPRRYAAPCLAGHRELPWGAGRKHLDAEGNVTKSCPGELFDMELLREVAELKLHNLVGMTSLDAELALRAAGVTI